jgi:hypothetical protein
MEVLMRSKFTFAVIAALVAVASLAYAKSIEDTLGGTIILTTKSIPAKLSSASAVKSLHQKSIDYATDAKKNAKGELEVTINYLVILKKALDRSGEISIIDITDGLPGNVKLSDTFFTSDRENRIFQPIPLVFTPTQLPGNRKYRVVLSSRGSVIAKGDFYLKAKAEKYDGKVEFTDEDTKKKD